MVIRLQVTDHWPHRPPTLEALPQPPGYDLLPLPGQVYGSLALAMSPVARSTNPSSIDRPVRCRTWSSDGFRDCPSSGFPASTIPPRMKPLRLVVAMLPFTPNSYHRWALPLLIHSTSGACRLYRWFRSFFSCARNRRTIASSSANTGSRSCRPAVFRSPLPLRSATVAAIPE